MFLNQILRPLKILRGFECKLESVQDFFVRDGDETICIFIHYITLVIATLINNYGQNQKKKGKCLGNKGSIFSSNVIFQCKSETAF